MSKVPQVGEHADQGKDWAGYGTLVLPDVVDPPPFIRGQDIDFVTRSDESKFRQTRRPVPQVYFRPCGGLLDMKSIREGDVRSHQKGLRGVKEGVHTYVGFNEAGAKAILSDLRFDKKEEPKHIEYDQYNETSLRWKYGYQDKNPGLTKGVDGAVHMSRDLIRSHPRGANVSGYYKGLQGMDVV